MKNVLKKSLSVFLAVAIVFCSAVVGLKEIDMTALFTIEAKAAEVDNFYVDYYWNDDDEKVYYIYGYNGTPSGALVIPEKYGDYPIVQIKYGAFDNCTDITSVTIPDSVTSIGNYAFKGCTGLTSITIPDSVTSIGYEAFEGCTGLTSVTIGKGVTSIGYEAFYGCTGLTSIEIPDSVTSIDEEAFSGCTGLTSVIIGKGVTSIGEEAFYGCTGLTSITIPDSVTSIGYGAFYKCTGLTTVTCNGRIGSSAFSGCTSLTSVTLGDGVTGIGSYAFEGCTGLTSVTLGDGVTSIGDYAFYKCTSLTSITIPDSVTSIGNYAFYGCTGLTSITIGKGVTVVGSWAFEDCDALKDVYITDIAAWSGIEFSDYDSTPLCYADNLYLNGTLVTEVNIPKTVKKIGSRVFYGCDSITKVTISEGVTEIGKAAFSGCTGITSIKIPDSVTSIGNSAFSGCTSLVEATLGKGLKAIPSYMFSGCGSLIVLNIPDAVTEIGYEAFSGCSSLPSINIPAGVKSIGGWAFSSCSSLKAVYITDLAAWCNIKLESARSNPCYSAEADLYLNNKLLTELVIPSTVKTVGDYAFYGCNSIESAKIHSGVSSIGTKAFYNCKNLTAINVDGGNAAYSSKDGVLFNKDQSRLIEYPDNKQNDAYTIPDSVKTFEEDTFDGANNIKTIVLGAGVVNIPNDLFNGVNSSAIKNVVIPVEVKSIGNNAFGWCWGMKDVFYEGTQAQWSSVLIAAGNDSFSSARIHYGVDIAKWDKHYTGPVVEKEPGCWSRGSQKYTCACGHEIVEELESIGHNYSTEWTVDRAPTCTSNGSQSHHCLNNCGNSIDWESIPATGHTPSDWILDKAATVDAPGSRHKECKTCKAVLERETIAQLKCAKPKLKTIANTTSGVKITWGKVSGADSYAVYRKTGSKGKYSKLTTTTKTGYTDKSAKSGKKYYYYVKAVNEAGTSSASSSKSIYYLADTTLKTPKSTKSGVTLNWTQIAGADGYMVYRKTGSGSYKKIATVKGVKKVKYTDKSAKKGKTYTYKIKAYKSKTYSAYSNAKKIKDKY